MTILILRPGGQKTRDALSQLQRDYDLPETGKIDKATKAALQQGRKIFRFIGD
ncbi:MAG: hypothetical protein GKR94_20325 [Gammaproteobacteria bacterium]|nr:hypothetical protein [Gammaproteobacteria bacterium]